MNMEWLQGFMAGVSGDAPTPAQWSAFRAKVNAGNARLGWPLIPSENQNCEIIGVPPLNLNAYS